MRNEPVFCSDRKVNGFYVTSCYKIDTCRMLSDAKIIFAIGLLFFSFAYVFHYALINFI